MKFSIQKTVVTGLVFLSLVIAGLLGNMIIGDWRGLSSLNTSAQATKAVAEVSQATIELSLERSLTQVALSLDEPIGGDLQRMLNDQRALSDQLFAHARETLLASGRIDRRDSLVQRLDASLQTMAALRRQADDQLSVAITARDGSLIYDIPSHIKDTVSEIDGLSTTLRSLIQNVPDRILATDAIIQQAWIIREFGGRERTLFAIATAREEPISRSDLSYMFQNHGKVLQAWWSIEDVMRYADVDPAVE